MHKQKTAKNIIILAMTLILFAPIYASMVGRGDGFDVNKDGVLIEYYDNRRDKKEITIPDKVTSIGRSAFQYCDYLTSIVISDSVTNIDGLAFSGCTSLVSVEIPNSVISIGDLAFAGCNSLTYIAIPESVTSIGSGAFFGQSLTAINVSENNSNYSSLDGVLFNKDQTILIHYPPGKPETNYIIPNSVTSIENVAFYWCVSLTSVVIPDSVVNFGLGAFRDSSNLMAINVNENNPNYSSIDGVLFNKDKTSIIQYPQGKSETSYNIPNSVTSIEVSSFFRCTSLTSIVIPNSVKSIGKNAFYGCASLESIIIPDSITNIDGGAFHSCTSLTSIIIPGSITSIGSGRFYNCTSLTSIIISDGVTSIEHWAFAGCTSLTSIVIPSSVTSIGFEAFSDCDNLTIHGVSGSYAEKYAKENKIKFQEL